MSGLFHDWLLGKEKKPGRKPIPTEEILKLYGSGETISNIRRAVKRSSGQMYSYDTIYRIVHNAIEAGNITPRRRKKS